MPYFQVAQVQQAAQQIAGRCPEMRVEESVLCRLIVILGRDMVSRLDTLIAPERLAELEYRLLLMLFARGGSGSPGELGVALTQSPANVTRIANRLAERRLITRKPHSGDRRRLVISLTATGERLVRRLLPRLTNALVSLFGEFDAGDRARFLDYLLRLLRALDEVPAAADRRARG
jgi:DNA-binding MarR family transcriptional regulator